MSSIALIGLVSVFLLVVSVVIMSYVSPVIAFCLVVIWIFSMIALGIFIKRKRTESMSKIAAQMGLTFHPVGEMSLLSTLPEFYLFAKGRYGTITNLMHGTFRGLKKTTVFDYEYRTGRRHPVRQTVVCFELERLSLPLFCLLPSDTLTAKIEAWGYSDIDFESYPDFSEHYLLTGLNEGPIRNIFTEKVVKFYEKNSGLCTEGNGNHLLFYNRPSQFVESERIMEHMEKAMEVLYLFDASEHGSMG